MAAVGAVSGHHNPAVGTVSHKSVGLDVDLICDVDAAVTGLNSIEEQRR